MNACRQESPVANSQSHVRCERANVITHENWQEYIKSFTGSRKSQVGDVTVGANQWDSDHTLMYLHFTFMMQSNSHSTVKSQERCLLNQGSKLSVYHYKGFNSFVTEEPPPPCQDTILDLEFSQKTKGTLTTKFQMEQFWGGKKSRAHQWEENASLSPLLHIDNCASNFLQYLISTPCN